MSLDKRKRCANLHGGREGKIIEAKQAKGDVIVNKATSHDTRTNKLKDEAWERITKIH